MNNMLVLPLWFDKSEVLGNDESEFHFSCGKTKSRR